jgi:ethanolamine phosphate phosphodiesterase
MPMAQLGAMGRCLNALPMYSLLTVRHAQPSDSTPHHLVLLADPQIVDPHTYPDRPWPLSTLTILHTDLYLRRSMKQIRKYLHPDTIFFLGDLFDGGREWGTPQTSSPEDRFKRYGDDFWMNEYIRFGNLFFSGDQDASGGSISEPRGKKIIASLPGNHDLGFANGVQLSVKNRFDTYFGPLNRVDVIGNHTFVTVDTVSLSAMDQVDPLTGSSGSGDGTATTTPNMQIWKPTAEFLTDFKYTKERLIRHELRSLAGASEQAYHMGALSAFLPNVSSLQSGILSVPRRSDIFPHATGSMFPTVLLTHVPLYRPRDTDCGPHREHGHAISVAAGYQYQNVLTPLISKDIVAKLGAEDITQVYSGDDHDYCEIEHSEFTGRIREITVKSMSWAMGVRKPGFLAVSLNNPVDIELASAKNGQGEIPGPNKDTIQNRLCLLPDQLSIFIHYLSILILTIVVLAIRAFVITSKDSSSSGRSAHSSSAHPLLPITEIHSPPLDSTDTTARLKASSISSTSGQPHEHKYRLPTSSKPAFSRSQSPSKSLLGTYGNLPPSSRSSSPFKPHQADDFAPAPHVPVVSSGADEDDDDWGMPSTSRRPPSSRRGLLGEFVYSVWQVAWPATLFYAWIVWNG